MATPVSGLEWIVMWRVDKVRLKLSQKKAFKNFLDIVEIRNQSVI